ncbi:MAG: alpha/beta hydrolase [Flavobacteriaceae bacterium]
MKIYRQVFFLVFFCSFYLMRGQQIKIEKFFSNELNDERVLQIYLPKSYTPQTSNTYPLTIILDSELVFDAYTGTLEYFTKNQAAPEHIIVGIANLTSELEYDYGIDLATGFPDEFGRKFMDFVNYELLPSLEERFPLSHFSCIIGHDQTAAFVNYFLVEDVPSFNAYISMDPVYFEGFHYLIDGQKNKLDNDFYYYFTNGYQGRNVEDISSSLAVQNSLESIEFNSFNYIFDDSKSKSKLLRFSQGISLAINEIYRVYRPISSKEFEEEIRFLSAEQTIDFLENKYAQIKYLYGSEVSMRPADIFRLESNIIDKENGDYLKEFGNMIIDLYPEEPLGYYYVGLYYEKGKSYRKALVKYKEGFEKVKGRHEKYDNYYRNIERVLEKIALN